MRTVFIVTILLHAIVHLLGFIKGFRLGHIQMIAADISKPLGIVWLAVCLLFMVTAMLHGWGKDAWWIAGTFAMLASQILIILYWKDAKAGTILNIIICLVVATSYGDWNFNRQFNREADSIFADHSNNTENAIVTEQMLDTLPYPVRNWLTHSGIVGKPKAQVVHLKQKGLMRTSRDATWMEAEAEQYFTIDKPAFVWKITAKVNSFMYFTGRDLFVDGKGNMLIKAYSLVPVVNGKGREIDQGTMLMYMGEICWFPSAALSPYIKWEEIDSTSARATMIYKDLKVSAVFIFDPEGRQTRLVAQRYKGTGLDATLENWEIPSTEWKEFNGIRIPSKGNAVWKLKDGDMDYYKWEITEVDYK